MSESLQQRAMSFISELVNTQRWNYATAYDLVREMVDANWQSPVETSREPAEQVRRDLVVGICAVFNGDYAVAERILDKYMPNRPKLPELRSLSYEDMCRVVTGSSENGTRDV